VELMASSSKAALAKDDSRPAIQNTRKLTADSLPWHFKAMSAVCNAWQQPGTRPGQARLITIAYSHYVERARWVLDLSPLRDMYDEDAHPPGLAMFAVHGVTDGAESATPCLVLPDGEVVIDSNKILPRLHELFPTAAGAPETWGAGAGLGWLYPRASAADVKAYEARLADILGANCRQLAYTFLLDEQLWTKLSRVGGPISRNTSKVEVWLFSLIGGKMGHSMKRLMRCHENRLDACVSAIDEIFAEASERLKTQKYLCGDSITAADITFAALGYPAIFPPEHAPVDIVSLDGIPQEYRALVDRWRATAAGQHILFLYKEHRWPKDNLDQLTSPKKGNGPAFQLSKPVSLKRGGPRDRYVRDY
jgi:glutathione S-transferase